MGLSKLAARVATSFTALVLLGVLSPAQETLHFDFDSPDESEFSSGWDSLTFGLGASSLAVRGAEPEVRDSAFATSGWSNTPAPDPTQFLHFAMEGPWVPQEIRHDWLLTEFGPTQVTVRTSLDGFDRDVATASRPPGEDLATNYEVSLDLSSLGEVVQNISYRLYYYGGVSGPIASENALIIEGSTASRGPGIGLKLFGPLFDEPDTLCHGDDDDPTGCSACPCGNSTFPLGGTAGGCLNSNGRSAKLYAYGSPSVSIPPFSTSDLRFQLQRATRLAFTILVSGDGLAPQDMANPCFGLGTGVLSDSHDGLRCAVGNLRRHGGRMIDLGGNVGIFGDQPWGGEGLPLAGLAGAGSGFVAGETRYFQAIYRDDPTRVCMRGLNTSQAIEVTFEP